MSNITITSNERSLSADWLKRLTVADGMLLLVTIATAVSRFTNLGRIPLSPDETAQAWASWQFWQPGSVATTGGSPAYFSLTNLLFPLFGSSDAIARLVPALFAMGIVLLPWLLRKQLGTVGALIASLLLAISPTQAIVGRTAGGDAIALFALLLIIVGWLRYEEVPEQRWFTAVFAGLAIGLTSSSLFYGGLVTLALTRLVLWRALFTPINQDQWRKTTTATATTTAALFLALSSLFLWHLPGLGAAAALPADWLSQFQFTGTGLLDSLLAFIRYEPFLLLGGATAVIWAIVTENKLAKQLTSWAIGLIILMLLQREQMGNAALLTLPAALLVGLMANHLLQTHLSRLGRAWAGGLFLLSGLIVVNLARYSRVITQTPQEFTSAWVILMALTALIVTIYFVGTLEGTAVFQGTFLGFLAFFILFQWGMGWQLTHTAANDPRERWVTTATDDDVRLMTTALQEISRQATNSDHDMTIFSSVDTPALRWYLRDFNRLQFGASLPVNATHDALISPNRADLALGSDYVGADYGLIRDGLQPQETPSQTPGIDWLRWQLFHESTRTINEERVILWWRVDLSNAE